MPSVEGWIKMWHIYATQYCGLPWRLSYSAMKKNEILPFAATWMYLEIVILSEVSQQKRRNTEWHPLYVESKQKLYKWTYKQKETHRLNERTYGYLHTLLCLNWMTNKDLLYSTRNSTQCYVAAWMGGDVGREWYMCMCGCVPLLTWNCHNTVC